MNYTSLINLSKPSYDDAADVEALSSNFQLLDDWLTENVITRHDDMFNDFVLHGLQPSTTAGVIVQDCESLWDEITPSAGVSVVLDTFDYKQGNSCLKINMENSAGVGILASKAISPTDLKGIPFMKLWIKSNVNTSAGDFSLLLSKKAMSQSPSATLPFPALIANAWTLIKLPLTNSSDLFDIISVGIQMNVDKGASSLWVDYITGVQFNSVISSGVAYVQGHRISKADTSHLFTENRDTYVYIDAQGNYQYKEVAVGGTEPNLPVNSIKLAKVVSNSYNITEVADLRNMSAIVVSPTLTDGQVTESKLATDSISTSKIKNSAVTSVKIATDAVLTHHIKDSQVTGLKLKDGDISIGSGNHASKAGKLDAEYRTFTVRGSYDSYNPEEVIAHGLNRVPKGFLLVNTDKPVQLYSGNSLWTNTHMYLRGTAPNAKVTIMIF